MKRALLGGLLAVWQLVELRSHTSLG
jgi:hypothetical protein